MELKKFFLKTTPPFIKKPNINWNSVRNVFFFLIGTIVLVVLVYPEKKPTVEEFHEGAVNASTEQTANSDNDPSQKALDQIETSNTYAKRGRESLNSIYSQGKPNTEKNSSMIIPRSGRDMSNSLMAGTRIPIQISETISVSNQGVPFIGMVMQDILRENQTAIPAGSRVIGDVSFDSSAGRAQILLHSVEYPNGQQKLIEALGMGTDGQVGVDGNLKSNVVSNTVGETLTRFIGAFAEGSITHGALGANEGGYLNGLKTALSDTAQNRANTMGEDMKKEKSWIELKSGVNFVAVLTQPFTFGEHGENNGR